MQLTNSNLEYCNVQSLFAEMQAQTYWIFRNVGLVSMVPFIAIFLFMYFFPHFDKYDKCSFDVVCTVMI